MPAPNVGDPILASQFSFINAAWTAYTPALTASTTSPTLGTASAAIGKYTQIGKLVFGYATVTFGTSGTAAGSGTYFISVPTVSVNPSNTVVGTGRIKCAGTYTPVELRMGLSSACVLEYTSAAVSGTLGQVTNSTPGAWTANDELRVQFCYESS